jgi:hypothetical protein
MQSRYHLPKSSLRFVIPPADFSFPPLAGFFAAAVTWSVARLVVVVVVTVVTLDL